MKTTRKEARHADRTGSGTTGPRLHPRTTVLVLERVLDSMDYAALARIHGVPAPYLRTRYSRAKAKLAAILQEGEHDDL